MYEKMKISTKMALNQKCIKMRICTYEYTPTRKSYFKKVIAKCEQSWHEKLAETKEIFHFHFERKLSELFAKKNVNTTHQ